VISGAPWCRGLDLQQIQSYQGLHACPQPARASFTTLLDDSLQRNLNVGRLVEVDDLGNDRIDPMILHDQWLRATWASAVNGLPQQYFKLLRGNAASTMYWKGLHSIRLAGSLWAPIAPRASV
jgi:hypothetical protein